MRVRMSPEAKSDLKSGVKYCDSQSPGLGKDFRESMIAEIETLKKLAGIPRRSKLPLTTGIGKLQLRRCLMSERLQLWKAALNSSTGKWLNEIYGSE